MGRIYTPNDKWQRDFDIRHGSGAFETVRAYLLGGGSLVGLGHRFHKSRQWAYNVRERMRKRGFLDGSDAPLFGYVTTEKPTGVTEQSGVS